MGIIMVATLSGCCEDWMMVTCKGSRRALVQGRAIYVVRYYLVAQSCRTRCSPMDSGLPGSSDQGISQARILEWVAIFFFRRSSWSRDLTDISCIGRQILYHWASRKAQSYVKYMFKFIRNFQTVFQVAVTFCVLLSNVREIYLLHIIGSIWCCQ